MKPILRIASVLSIGALAPLPAPHASAHTVQIRMTRDSTGTRFYFEPSTVSVYAGDTLRFVNGAGMHNVDFLADSNPAGVRLPAATPVAKHQGDHLDLVLHLPPGRYVYVCDPHVREGMVGHVIVENRDRDDQ